MTSGTERGYPTGKRSTLTPPSRGSPRTCWIARDGWVCQYCGLPAENVDHVIPKSRGGRHVWENVVAACRRCNSKKENRLAHETGLRLRSAPIVPRDGLRLSLGRVEPEWEAYL